MPESANHMYLVEQLVRRMLSNFDVDNMYSLTDQPNSKCKPMKIRGFIPDYYCYKPKEETLIIGEAKTTNDVVSKHTIEQVSAFLQECNQYNKSRFFLAVPWQMVNYAKGMIRKICTEKELTVDFCVLENLKDTK